VLAAEFINPLVDPVIEVAKTVTPGTAVRGETVTYVITAENTGEFNESDLTVVDEMPAGLVYTPGTATVNGVATEPEIAGRTLTWDGLDLAAGATLAIQLQARVAGDAGEMVNRAWVTDLSGAPISDVASATLRISPEAVFDCTDIIGRVFDDQNMNGHQDGLRTPPRENGITDQTYYGGKFHEPPADEIGAEHGLPRVRLATVDGTVITTDEYGRFSVPCAALPQGGIGSNFTLKLDETSLPTGYHVTTENPRTIRVTAGTMARINFGAALADVVEIALTDAAFAGRSPSPELSAGIAQLVRQIGDAPVVIQLGYYRNGEDSALARARLRAAEALIQQSWRDAGGRGDLVIDSVIAEVQ